jgi:hypothetical protein
VARGIFDSVVLFVAMLLSMADIVLHLSVLCPLC